MLDLRAIRSRRGRKILHDRDRVWAERSVIASHRLDAVLLRLPWVAGAACILACLCGAVRLLWPLVMR